MSAHPASGPAGPGNRRRSGPCLARLALAFALALGCALPSAAPAAAEEPPQGEQSPGELAREGADRLLRALEGLIRLIPQYEAPELNDEGDIIIRRKRPGQDPAPVPKPRPKPEVDETET